jgi:hypothetical protein
MHAYTHGARFLFRCSSPFCPEGRIIFGTKLHSSGYGLPQGGLDLLSHSQASARAAASDEIEEV